MPHDPATTPQPHHRDRSLSLLAVLTGGVAAGALVATGAATAAAANQTAERDAARSREQAARQQLVVEAARRDVARAVVRAQAAPRLRHRVVHVYRTMVVPASPGRGVGSAVGAAPSTTTVIGGSSRPAAGSAGSAAPAPAPAPQPAPAPAPPPVVSSGS